MHHLLTTGLALSSDIILRLLLDFDSNILLSVFRLCVMSSMTRVSILVTKFELCVGKKKNLQNISEKHPIRFSIIVYSYISRSFMAFLRVFFTSYNKYGDIVLLVSDPLRHRPITLNPSYLLTVII